MIDYLEHARSDFTWWLESLNKRFGRPWKRDLITLFGYMSSWKTEFTYFVSRKNAEQGNKVCYISLELPEFDMKLRIARKRAWISKDDAQTGKYTEHQKEIVNKEMEKMNNLKNLYIFKPEDCGINGIEHTIRMFYDEWCRLFIIDNLDKIPWNENDNVRQQEISSRLQDIKNELNICIILIHHAKKPFNSIQQYMPAWMVGLRGTQKILDNSTQVFEVYRDLDPENNNVQDKARVTLYQYKDTFEGANWCVDIYFNKWDYTEKWIGQEN